MPEAMSAEDLEIALFIEGEAAASYLDHHGYDARDWREIDDGTKHSFRVGDNGINLWKLVDPKRLLVEGLAGFIYARESLMPGVRVCWGGMRRDLQDHYRAKARDFLRHPVASRERAEATHRFREAVVAEVASKAGWPTRYTSQIISSSGWSDVDEGQGAGTTPQAWANDFLARRAAYLSS